MLSQRCAECWIPLVSNSLRCSSCGGEFCDNCVYSSGRCEFCEEQVEWEYEYEEESDQEQDGS